MVLVGTAADSFWDFGIALVSLVGLRRLRQHLRIDEVLLGTALVSTVGLRLAELDPDLGLHPLLGIALVSLVGLRPAGVAHLPRLLAASELLWLVWWDCDVTFVLEGGIAGKDLGIALVSRVGLRRGGEEAAGVRADLSELPW